MRCILHLGQPNDAVIIHHTRCLGSVEDRAHDLLSSPLEDIFARFGQGPDMLEGV